MMDEHQFTVTFSQFVYVLFIALVAGYLRATFILIIFNALLSRSYEFCVKLKYETSQARIITFTFPIQ